MTSVAEVQALLRFLSQDAKVPVPIAMSKVKDLKEASLTTPESLSKAPLPTVQSIFPDEKLAKQILSAAKRSSKKRTSLSASTPSQRSKRTKTAVPKPGEQVSPADLEASLALPTLSDISGPAVAEEIGNTIIYTNRAPLVVAFVVQLLKYTMPSQPLSSRLSLAHAVMSMGAKSKAIHLGIQSGKTAEDEGWGEGQPRIKIMGRELRVMRRWGYEWQNNGGGKKQESDSIKQEEKPEEQHSVLAHTTSPDTEIDTQETIKGDPSPPSPHHKDNKPPSPVPETDTEPPLWALNLETLRSTSNTTALLSSTTSTSGTNLPIHDPHSARNYILRVFATAPSHSTTTTNVPPNPSSSPAKAKKAPQMKENEEKERNLALLLHA
ncbi:MAG: hypothetical protein Q9181_005393, partial [Wetmoreana brouardii]